MNRNIGEMSEQPFDIVVIGGGINGVTCAWDAVLRGYKVALFERDDFGAHTSSQSAKIAHSGLRYLQHADFRRMRESIRERNYLTRNAPHLARPQPFLLPVYGHGIKGIETMSTYMKLFDVFSLDRRSFEDPSRRIPGTKIIGRNRVLELAPDIEPEGLTGGVVWYESQMHNTERLLFSFLRNAEEHGGLFFNYCEVEKLHRTNEGVSGVTVRDTTSGAVTDVPARMVINATGPWVMKDLGLGGNLFNKSKVHASKAFSLLTRPLSDSYAISFGIKPMYEDKKAVVNKKSSIQFAIPWRNHSLIGSLHLACDDDPEKVMITDDEITAYLERINEGYPKAKLERRDIVNILWGIIPAEEKGSAAPLKHYKIIDHQAEDGVAGLISVAGVKFTTSRDVAKKTIDLVERHLKGTCTPSKTHAVPLWGGDIRYWSEFRTEALNRHTSYDQTTVERLVDNYGARYVDILRLAEEDPALAECLPDTQILKAEIVHACRHEKVHRLSDVVLRRTDMGSLKMPSDTALNACAELMAEELGWESQKIASEIADLKAGYRWDPYVAQ